MYKVSLNFAVELPILLLTQVQNFAVSGNTYWAECIDDFDTPAGGHGFAPTARIMTVRDGRVDQWRDYYNRATLMSAMGVEEFDPKQDKKLGAEDKHYFLIS